MEKTDKEKADEAAAAAQAEKKKGEVKEGDEPEDDEPEVIDYDKELEEFEKAEHNRDGFSKRVSKKVTKNDDEDEDDDDKDEDKTTKKVSQQISVLREELAQDYIDAQLEKLTSNPSEQRLIKLVYDSKIVKSGFGRAAILQDLEMAKAIANRRTILKTNKELAVALKSKKQPSGSGQGSGSGEKEVKVDVLSPAQITSLKARGWDDKKIERYKQTILAQKGKQA